MSIHSHYLPIDQVKSGMVLAIDLLDTQGHVLLPAGLTLNESNLKSLLHHGVDQLCVEREATSPEDLLRLQALQLARLETLFRQAGENRAMSDLKRYLQHYRKEQAK